ncbi:MAG TPA: hypothetical protein VEU52_07010 [Candidatus Limnocylindrales bacterium]|jgi:hypothetical protein|nr:hypothetical protein [Candidatus Limnocylindrales bacterium]
MRHEPHAGAEKIGASGRALNAGAANSTEPRLDDPSVVLSLLEADQVVAAKRQTHFGPRKFSLGTRALLWGMRLYVILMLVLVLVSIFRVMLPVH